MRDYESKLLPKLKDLDNNEEELVKVSVNGDFMMPIGAQLRVIKIKGY